MKIVNIMNFVRQIDQRKENSTERLLQFTTEQLKLINEYDVDNTFLLQYDTLCDEDFVNLFKSEVTDRTELGIWYEIVEPMSKACGIPYESERGWKWDWHIIPGYSMAYSPMQREMLIDETMRKFKEVFGYYPKTVAGWLIDTHTLNHLAKNYDVSAVAICRDQANTDAYTLLGGYFNGAYYPSKNNIFTPAQSDEYRTNVPIFRLLGPCPIHNYDNNKYSSDEFKALGSRSACFTMEPCWYMGSHEDIMDWMFEKYYDEESLGFAYSQIGQENSFLNQKDQVMAGLKMQIEKLICRKDVEFKKMCDTGEIFKAKYPNETPATCVVASDNFDSTDVQSVYYDCKNYTANLFRFEDKLFLRSFFMFDEKNKDVYLTDTCRTFDAVYENFPIIDTMFCPDGDRKQCGLMIDADASEFGAKKVRDGVLEVTTQNRSVTFFDDRIEICAPYLTVYKNSLKGEVSASDNVLYFEYKGYRYKLSIEGAAVSMQDGSLLMTATADTIALYPQKEEE